MNKKYIPFFLIVFFLVCYAIRIADSFFIRTDQGPIGELFAHKLIGIALLAAALRYLHITWTDIGFKRQGLTRGILIGIAIGGSSYLAAFVIEIDIAAIQGTSPSLQFYVSNYAITGNAVLGNGVLFIVICVIGNIINVIMENGVFSGLMITVAQKRHSFFIANGFYSSFLFGLWHRVMPLRNFIDGNQSLSGAIISALILFGSSFLFSIQTGIQYKQASSLWDGMVVHFINNASANLFHVVFPDGSESAPVMRIAIAQTMMFSTVLARYFLWKRQIRK
jgi:hypothetical protein